MHPRPVIFDHPPFPGPIGWDWRCLLCSRPTADHAGWLARRRWRRAQRRGDR